jgi:HK97 family phage major capsid protein
MSRLPAMMKLKQYQISLTNLKPHKVENKELELKLAELETSVKAAATKEAKEEAAKEIKAFEEKHKEAIEGYTELKAAFDKLKKDADANQPAIDAYVASKNKVIAPLQETKSFNEILAEAFEKNEQQIKGFKKGGDITIDLAPEVKDINPKTGRREVKAVGDMSISANFSNSTAFTQQVVNNVIPLPYNRVWLGDLLPGGTATGSTIVYPKESGGEGGAAPWTDYTQNKAQMDFDLAPYTAYLKWIAGFVIVERDMLDDFAFMLSYIQNKMLISLKTAENDVILNGTSDTNPIQGLLDNATAYNGTYTKPVDRLIDAGWGQIVEGTNNFYNPTNAIVMPRDAVKIGLNKADGSGEYDLPNGSVAFVNGKLTVGGIEVDPTTQIGTNNFLVFDKSATMFLKRLQPEIRMFEDSTLAKLNKIMFRIEERVTLLTFNNNALVTGTLDATV